MTDPQSGDPDRPLSRRELRERAQESAASASVPEPEATPEPGPEPDPVPEQEQEPTPEPEHATPTLRAEVPAAPAAPTVPREGSIELLFDGEEEEPKTRRGGGCLVTVIILLVILGGIAAGGMWAWNEYGERVQAFLGLDGPHDYEEGEATGEAFVTIEQGDTGTSLSPKLYEAGITLETDSFSRYLRAESLNPVLIPGVYQMQQRMTSAAVVEALDDPANRMEDTVQLPEGFTVESTVTRIAESLGMDEGEVEAAVEDPSDYGVSEDSLEGWLFPATYTFEPGTTAEQIVQRMVDRTRQSLSSAGVPDEQVHEVLTIASIIQREARFEDDFYRVSRVIHNRLDPETWGDTNGLLQMDSTVQYGYGEAHAGRASTSAEARNDDNPYNTYMHQGLPAGPIANPGDLAIDAAMNPVDGPWLYFVTVDLSTGETEFNTTYAEHLVAVEEWQTWCRENPDGGC